MQSIVWHASDRRPAPIVANATIERLGLAQWDAPALPFAALVSSGRHNLARLHTASHMQCSVLAFDGIPVLLTLAMRAAISVSIGTPREHPFTRNAAIRTDGCTQHLQSSQLGTDAMQSSSRASPYGTSGICLQGVQDFEDMPEDEAISFFDGVFDSLQGTGSAKLKARPRSHPAPNNTVSRVNVICCHRLC